MVQMCKMGEGVRMGTVGDRERCSSTDSGDNTEPTRSSHSKLTFKCSSAAKAPKLA